MDLDIFQALLKNFFVFLSIDYEPGIPTILSEKNTQPHVEECLDLIQGKSKKQKFNSTNTGSLNVFNNIDLSSHLKNHNDWESWRFSVHISLTGHFEFINVHGEERPCRVSAKINLLQAAILLQDIRLVKIITKTAQERGKDILDAILMYEVDLTLNPGWHLARSCK